MGTGKGIQQLALILLFAAILAGCASSNKAGGPSGIDQMIPGATKWGHYNGENMEGWAARRQKETAVVVFEPR